MRALAAVVACAVMLAFTGPAIALLGLPETMEGTIESVTKDTLSVKSQEGDALQIVEIQINDQTQFEEATSLESLTKGDQVKVKYTEEENGKIALSIAKISKEKVTYN